MENLNKIIVGFLMSVFIITSLFIVLLLAIYYFTPNNYIIGELDKKNIIELNSKEINLNSHSEIELFFDPNYYYQIIEINNTDDEDVTKQLCVYVNVSNNFKSQNITLCESNLIKIKSGSKIFILNNTNENKNFKIICYAT